LQGLQKLFSYTWNVVAS